MKKLILSLTLVFSTVAQSGQDDFLRYVAEYMKAPKSENTYHLYRYEDEGDDLGVTEQGGNTTINSYNKAKQYIGVIYSELAHKTVYCNAGFLGGSITYTNGFTTPKYARRAKKLEWEHIVPAQFFGQHFKAWRDGDARCVTRKGKSFKGRACASKVSKEYRHMQADMHNLYPSIGAVNAIRRNYRYADLDVTDGQFGTCKISQYDHKFRPPESSRGKVARASLYFENAYDNYTLSDSQRKLFMGWNKQYPPDNQECTRNELIERVQGNINLITEEACVEVN